MGAQVPPDLATLVCDKLERDGVSATALWVRWGELDLGGGRYDWAPLDDKVEALRACGLEVGLHIQARGGAGQPSAMPEDVAAYARFLGALATHLRGRVRRYSIENEAVSPTTWSGSLESYFELLDAAYPAIKAADAQAIVLDSGLSGAALGIARAYALYQEGQRPAALALVQETLAEAAGGLSSRIPESEGDLEAVFADPVATRAIAWLPLAAEHQNSFDALQIHYYGPWERLTELARWIGDRGIGRPLEVWELGRRYQGQVSFDETVHAEESARLLVTAAGEGSRWTLFVRYLEWPEKGLPGLVTRTGGRPALDAFRVVAQGLEGFLGPQRLDLGPAAWGYRFSRPQGDVYVLWAREGQATVHLPVAGPAVTVTDLWGQSTTADPASLTVGASPVLVSP